MSSSRISGQLRTVRSSWPVTTQLNYYKTSFCNTSICGHFLIHKKNDWDDKTVQLLLAKSESLKSEVCGMRLCLFRGALPMSAYKMNLWYKDLVVSQSSVDSNEWLLSLPTMYISSSNEKIPLKSAVYEHAEWHSCLYKTIIWKMYTSEYKPDNWPWYLTQ